MARPLPPEQMLKLDSETTQPMGAPAAAPRAVPGTTWFGSVDAEGYAIEDSVWTFDHGGADPHEGWHPYVDPPPFPAWKHISASVWDGHENKVEAPIINPDGSGWIGGGDFVRVIVNWGNHYE